MTLAIKPVLLAAGQSTRFGSDKLLHPLTYKDESKPLILHAIQPWLTSFSELNIVVRQDNHALVDLLQASDYAPRLKLIPATDAEHGMSASLVSGITFLQQADGWLVGLADMPFIDSKVIKDSMTAFQQGAVLTQPEFAGRRGHPVGFHHRYLSELLALSGDKGARSIVQRDVQQVTVIPSPDNGIYLDIDSRDSHLLTQSI